MIVKENKIKVKRNFLGVQSIEVVEVEYELGKPIKVLKKTVLYKGSLQECYIYLKCLNEGNFID